MKSLLNSTYEAMDEVYSTYKVKVLFYVYNIVLAEFIKGEISQQSTNLKMYGL